MSKWHLPKCIGSSAPSGGPGSNDAQLQAGLQKRVRGKKWNLWGLGGFSEPYPEVYRGFLSPQPFCFLGKMGLTFPTSQEGNKPGKGKYFLFFGTGTKWWGRGFQLNKGGTFQDDYCVNSNTQRKYSSCVSMCQRAYRRGFLHGGVDLDLDLPLCAKTMKPGSVTNIISNQGK